MASNVPTNLPPSLSRNRNPQLVTIVVPALNEEGNVRTLYESLTKVLAGLEWEVVFVDDGSTDQTFATILELSHQDRRVKGLSLSKNFGHQYALLAGMRNCRGEVIISMDADMQHPPELIQKMLDAWRQGFKIVHTKRIPHNTGWIKRKTSDWFYQTFTILSGMKLEAGESDFRLLDRRVVNMLVQQDTGPLFLRGLVHSIGYHQTTLEFDVAERFWGKSKYSLWRMVLFAFQGLTAYSTLPLRLGVTLGFVTSALAFAELFYILWVALRGLTVPGWASLAGLVSLLFGVSFLLIGFLGVYIGHIFSRVQRKPLFIIETTSDEIKENHEPKQQ